MTAPDRIYINKVHGQHPEDWDFTDGKHLTKRQLSDKIEYLRADLARAPLADALAVPTCDRPFIMGANHGYDTALEQVAELLEAMKEVLRISDRDHAAWHRAHAALRAIGERAE